VGRLRKDLSYTSSFDKCLMKEKVQELVDGGESETASLVNIKLASSG